MVLVYKLLFWGSLFLVFYTYLGYGIVLTALVRIKRLIVQQKHQPITDYTPVIALVIPCYNEADILEAKIENCLALSYPSDKISIVFITDGSTDASMDIIRRYPKVTLLHEDKRGGKVAAENRVMKLVTAPVIVFSDANTILPAHALKELVKHYTDPSVGAVSGEKRILQKDKEAAAGAGEGIYWKYESFLKKMDSELLTIVGAAGELFSFRKELYQELEADTILDDFMLSLRIAKKGYRVVYEPAAYAMETSSVSVKEELKRKIRICAGGWQSIIRLRSLLNPFPRPILTFQYISHRVLRWTLTPLALLLLIPVNAWLCWYTGELFYLLAFIAQLLFYTLALCGWYLENRSISIKLLFVPYYFFIMNYAVFLGFFRYLKGKQSAAWERSQRQVQV
ncbi:MAG: glycosyl transferase family 2 [Cytophagaceae bacterium]|jgi:cellulose synthase/poly-beta-1,6-N-acetylglucosamine synthase-like glycosyltransferase|nr:glycosyl transferase family 2 [Cytophagaceae bacterium]